MSTKRVIKHPDVRKLEITRAAEILFRKKGYAATSVESIIQKAGIAKGTFYYYFKTKQDILKNLVEQIATNMETYFISVIEDNHLSAIQKLKKLLRSPEKKEKINPSVMKIIHRPENRELQEELNIIAIKVIAPLLAKVFQQGKKEGVFNNTVSVESMQLILAGSQFVLDSGLFHWSSEQRKKFLKELQRMTEQIAGAKPNTLSFISSE